jgi:hypothetical protein
MSLQDQVDATVGADLTGGLRAARYRFTFDVLDALDLVDAKNTFSGATLRGALGSVLRRTVCITGAPTCEGCRLRPECAYGFMLETVLEPESEMAARYRNPPRPFVLHVLEPERTRFSPGEPLRFDVVLLGKATRYLPHLVYALRDLEQSGLGAGAQRGGVRLTAVDAMRPDEKVSLFGENGHLQEDRPSPLPLDVLAECNGNPAPQEIELSFVTPLRLAHGGDWLRPERFELHHLVETLGRRLRVLASCYGANAPVADFNTLTEAATHVRTTRRALRWESHQRTSRRGKKIHMGGLVGEVTCAGELDQLLPLLKIGHVIHAGKKTPRGQGQYAIH